MEAWIGIGIPTGCYLLMSGLLLVRKSYPDAMVFFGYAFANVGLMLRILK